MRTFSVVSVILAVVALGASGAIWASTPAPVESPTPGATNGASHDDAKAQAGDGNPAVLYAFAEAEQAPVAAKPSPPEVLSSGQPEPQRNDRAMMLMAGVGMLATVALRGRKR